MILKIMLIVYIILNIFGIIYYYKAIHKNLQNKVHFYIQRDGYGIFHLSIGRLIRESKLGLWMPIKGKSCRIASSTTYIPYFEEFNLSFPEYKNLKWEDEPVEVYLNLKDLS